MKVSVMKLPAMKLSALELLVREQEGTERLGRREIEEIQLRKLNGLLKREKDRNGFYGGLPERLSSLAELSGLPLPRSGICGSRGTGWCFSVSLRSTGSGRS